MHALAPPNPNTFAKISRYKWEQSGVYAAFSGTAHQCKSIATEMEAYRDRNGRRVAILLKNVSGSGADLTLLNYFVPCDGLGEQRGRLHSFPGGLGDFTSHFSRPAANKLSATMSTKDL